MLNLPISVFFMLIGSVRPVRGSFCPWRRNGPRGCKPAKVEAASGLQRQPARPRPRDAAGRRSAADSSPARRVEKYQASEGRGRGEGRKSTGEGDRENKDAPAAAPPPATSAPSPVSPSARACLQATRRALQPPWVPGPRPLLCPGRN